GSCVGLRFANPTCGNEQSRCGSDPAECAVIRSTGHQLILFFSAIAFVFLIPVAHFGFGSEAQLAARCITIASGAIGKAAFLAKVTLALKALVQTDVQRSVTNADFLQLVEEILGQAFR